jgi:precorrin-3B C17-methyltransferase
MSKGKIYLVGFGPGDPAHMSLRAHQAITEADVVLGYSAHIKLVADLLNSKQVIHKGVTEEAALCSEAYEHARAGKIVALISAGDIGIYGKAGPAYEALLQSGWSPGNGLDVEQIPGTTALSACAALVGAPLTHDLCTISLSDLRTPWPVIARRLEAAAYADFVVALYNPKSGRRTQQIVEAQRTLLLHRSSDTPVAIVQSAYRKKQSIQLTNLGQMTECDIGILSTVLIGNSNTFVCNGLMITPHGYANKYRGLSGQSRNGESAEDKLSMGLTGWKACVRRHLRETPDPSLVDVAHHFNVPLGEILSAIALANAADSAGPFRATAAEPARLDDVIDAARLWGPLRAVLHTEGGAHSEMQLRGSDIERRDDWLHVTNAHFHLHINWKQVTRGWFVRRGDRMHGVYFTNSRNETVLNLLLEKPDGNFDPAGLEYYLHAQHELGAHYKPEVTDNT